MFKRFGRIALRAIRHPRNAWLSLFWLLAGKPRRAHVMLLPDRLNNDPTAYSRWIETFETPAVRNSSEVERDSEVWPVRPTVSVVMAVYNPCIEFLETAIASVTAQSYGRWELCIADDASSDPAVREAIRTRAAADTRIKFVFRPQRGNICEASNSALELATGDIVAFLDHDDRMASDALYEIARAAVMNGDADVVYSDEDQIDAAGNRFRPHFKPDWNRELFLTQNYLNHLTAIRRPAVERAGGFRAGFEGSQDHDLLLRVIGDAANGKVHHIPRILYHWRNFDTHTSVSLVEGDSAAAARRLCVADFLARHGWQAEVVAGPGGYNRIVRRVPEPQPLVSLIVPTRDQFELVRTCLESLRRTEYPRFEIVVVDNGTTCPKAKAYLRDVAARPSCRVISDDRPFNFSALNNMAVEAARGEYLAFINNDVEAIDGGWLNEMVSHAVLPEVGAVGSKLLYDDGRIQHAGVILGLGHLGIADHSHKYFENTSSGYFHRPKLQQYVSAVTGACMVVSKRKFREAGGFDAANLAVAFNDVDLCLRLNDLGYHNYYTPYAVLYHHESMTRGRDRKGEKAERFAREAAYMKKRWGNRLTVDPYYNPNLCSVGPKFGLRQR